MGKHFDILVIDDEPVILDSIRKLCSAEGWQVDAASDVINGLAKIERSSYRLIICDIMLPEMDGFQLLERLAEKDICTPVIVTTGYSTLENAVKSLISGAIDFLAKPFTADELLSAVYRGLKYGEIHKSLENSARQSDDAEIIYVPCPPRYLRLGYAAWLHVDEEGLVKTGVTDLFLKSIGALAGINLFDDEEDVVQGNSFATILGENELYHNVLSPISGRILRRNKAVVNQENLILKDPYFEGWLYTIIPSELEYELKHLTPCAQGGV